MTDLNKPADQILVDLVNFSNRDTAGFTPFLYDALSFRGVADLPEGSQRNTVIQVTDMETPDESDWMSIYYNRVALGTVFNRIQPVLPYDEAYETVHDMLDDLNARFGVLFTVDDLEDDAINYDDEIGLPFPLVIRAKTTSRIYRGHGGLELVDPAIGTAIITPVEVDETAGIMHADNSEIKINVHVRKTTNGTPQAIGAPDEEFGKKVYNLEMSENDNWELVLTAELLNQINGSKVSDLYNVRILGSTHGDSNFDFSLFREGTDCKFKSADRKMTVPAAKDPNDAKLTAVFDLKELGYPITQEALTSNGAMIGSAGFLVVAERKIESAPQVALEVAVYATTGLILSSTMFQASEELEMIPDNEDDYILPFTWQLRLSGAVGTQDVLNDDIEISVELPSKASGFLSSPISVGGVEIRDDGTGIIPAGLEPGVYELEGALVFPADTDLEVGSTVELTISYEDPYTEATDTASAVWNVAGESDGGDGDDKGDGDGDEQGLYVEEPGILQLTEQTFTYTPAVWVGNVPEILLMVIISPSPGPSEYIRFPLDSLTFPVDEDMQDNYVRVVEIANQGDEEEVTAESNVVGPVPYEPDYGDFRTEDNGGSGGGNMKAEHWLGVGTNLIEQCLTTGPGCYVIVNELRTMSGELRFDGAIPYQMNGEDIEGSFYFNRWYAPAVEDVEAGDGSTDSLTGQFRADVTFYDSTDTIIGTATGTMRFSGGV